MIALFAVVAITAAFGFLIVAFNRSPRLVTARAASFPQLIFGLLIIGFVLLVATAQAATPGVVLILPIMFVAIAIVVPALVRRPASGNGSTRNAFSVVWSMAEVASNYVAPVFASCKRSMSFGGSSGGGSGAIRAST